ncbi:MAG: hypothetical protein ACOY93_14800 [Bacillota bacterium]
MPLTLRLGTYLLQTAEDEDLRLLQSTVALLRTVFENHHVDPEHQSALFFHGRALPGGPYDFSVIHRGDEVVLSDFTFPTKGPEEVRVPLVVYAREVTQFARQVLAAEWRPMQRPDWQQRYVEGLRSTAQMLTRLAERLVREGAAAFPAIQTLFQEQHGVTKRPLELQVKAVLSEPVPWEPVPVVARPVFGPLRLKERLPVRLNGGDMVLATVEAFQPDGVHLTLEGVGNGGVYPGDRLIGLQLFYP